MDRRGVLEKKLDCMSLLSCQGGVIAYSLRIDSLVPVRGIPSRGRSLGGVVLPSGCILEDWAVLAKGRSWEVCAFFPKLMSKQIPEPFSGCLGF